MGGDFFENNGNEQQYADILIQITKELSRFLGDTLPKLSDNWWTASVVSSFNDRQRNRLQKDKISSIDSFDLAALLKIFDYNWYQLESGCNISPETRHYLKEMQTIRNKWSHLSSTPLTPEDKYRDLDTIQRLLTSIHASDSIITHIRDQKKQVIGQGQDGQKEKESVFEFKEGQLVLLKSNPAKRGVIVSKTESRPENRYTVFIEEEKKTYYSSQIEAYVDNNQTTMITKDEFNAQITSLLIKYPGISTLYSLNAARIDFIPYQFRPVLKFIHSERPRLLIADSVGVGKTIEAGLILKELEARRDVKSVLIICPRPLVIEQKWLNEMKRFDETFTQLDSAGLDMCIAEMHRDGEWPDQKKNIIIPYSVFDETLLYGEHGKGSRNKTGLLSLDPPPRFDMVIVDEAHHIRNQNTFTHKAVRFFCDNAEAVLFLTATPIQLDSKDLYVLLNTLRPDLITDLKVYEMLSEPNGYINIAVNHTRMPEQGWNTKALESLLSALSTTWGQAYYKKNPEFVRTLATLNNDSISDEERIQLIADIESFHTFARIINRTRRRDIGDFTIRDPQTVRIEFTPEQSLIHDELLNIQRQIIKRIHGDISVNFLLSTIRRQAASCIFGLVPLIKEILSRHLNDLELDEISEYDNDLDYDKIGSIREQIDTIIELCRDISQDDPKFNALLRIIEQKQSNDNNKIILFSSFRHTLGYLYSKLMKKGVRVGLVHGGTKDDERLELRNRFEMPRGDTNSLDVMLFSEIGCEGLDYQFCDTMVNYDLPWNPMRIEQRIGRIDRNGQRSEKVLIFNMITPGTVDAEIYDRCLIRIGVFNSALGASEEILGEITKEIKEIGESFVLTEEEIKVKLRQLSDNKIRLFKEQDDLEQKQLQLFGIQVPQTRFKDDIEAATSYWLSPKMLELLVSIYLSNALELNQDYILGTDELKNLRLSQEARNTLLEDFKQLKLPISKVNREWENWLKGITPYQNITFDSQCAMQNPKALLINPTHPLIKQAMTNVKVNKNAFITLEAHDYSVPEGIYKFAIYQWHLYGIKGDTQLVPVTESEELSKKLISLLENSEENKSLISPDSLKQWEHLEEVHYKKWKQAQVEHKNKTDEHAKFQRESLTISHKSRMALLNEQLIQANDDKIRRMRMSQIASAEADYARRMQEIEIAIERADISSSAIGFGIIKIIKGD